nr:MAG TPA: hypothetical protein [Caudoviricetes sp.]
MCLRGCRWTYIKNVSVTRIKQGSISLKLA